MAAITATTEHVAVRPSWDCVACGKAWPCDPAREALAVELDRVQLGIYMCGNLTEAVGDMTRIPPDEAFERFLAWTR